MTPENTLPGGAAFANTPGASVPKTPSEVYTSRTPEIDAAETLVDQLQDQLDTKLNAAIETAIHRADAAEVRRLRDSRSDLEGQLYLAKVTLKKLEIAHAEEQEKICGVESTRLSKVAEKYLTARRKAEAEHEEMNRQSSEMYAWSQRFQARFHRATQELAEIKQAETVRMRQIARQA